jgi:yecA family protein
MTRSTPAFTYDELDAILRGAGGPGGFVGMSAIDGLIAALVAAPAFVHPEEWLPLIFGGRKAQAAEGSTKHRAIQTIFQRYNEVSDILANRPAAYRPIFMIDRDGSIVLADWAAGFMLGVGLRQKPWASCILLTEHRRLLAPILVFCESLPDFLPDLTTAEKQRTRATAVEQIPETVAAIWTICNPHRAAEARSTGRRPSHARRPKH